MTPLQRGIKKAIEENCKKGMYEDIFSPDFQKEIKEKSEDISKLVTEDEEFMETLNNVIEESIRVMILR